MAAEVASRPAHPDDWRPNPGPQHRFLGLTCFEALYGGAAGGGKSDALLVDAVRYVGRGYGNKYQALLLRRNFPELKKSLVGRSQDLYPRLGGTYNQSDHVWTFPAGEKVWFGHVDNDAALQIYQGGAFPFVGFDEETQFTRKQYLYLFSRCRSAHDVPCRIRGATNPGGEGADWVFERFGPWLNPEHPEPAAPGEVRYFIPQHPDDGEGELQVPKGTRDHEGNLALGRVFVPARLEDNPALARTNYAAGLAALDPVTREQLRRGNWLIKPAAGLYFRRGWVEWVDVPPDGLAWVRAWDLAGVPPTALNPNPDWTVGVKMARHGDRIFVGDVVRMRGGPGEVQATILATAAADGRACKIVLPQDPGQAGVDQVDNYQRLLSGYAVTFARPTGDKVTRFGPFSAAASPPAQLVTLVRGPWNDTYVAELEAFPDGSKKDQADATSDAFNNLPPPPVRVASPRVALPKRRL